MAWLETVRDHEIFLSAVTLGELQAGVKRTRHNDSRKAAEIETWVDQLAASYQILPMDARAFREWARLMEGRPNQLLEGAMIAATARVHRLTVATRNTRDFEPLDVLLVNPFNRDRQNVNRQPN